MKKLIIVCEEKCKTYGDYLAQLISLDDDNNEKIIGVKDGEVVAQVWTEKEYNANSAQIASSQYILFIGNKKLIKEKSKYMQIKFSDFGMIYGWLGKQAAMTVNKPILADEYNEFLNFAMQYKNDLERLINKEEKRIKLYGERKMSLVDVIHNSMLPINKIGNLKSVLLSKKIEDQQFSCMVMKFYIDSLGEFLECD